MSDRSFRRYRVSEVCRCGGFLLAFAASDNVDETLRPRRDGFGFRHVHVELAGQPNVD
jgi:hypothetical protein